MASNTPKPKVYRLRRCPAHLDRYNATKLLSEALGDVEPADIHIQSLVMDLDPWARPPTKVGTLMFHKVPKLIEDEKEENEWKVPVVALEKPLLLDTHFLGMTPLNDVEREQHEFNCVAISGLASHPFGSWQGADKLFMWIRDAIPRAMPNTRAVIYGYDTMLKGSNSFQSVQDIAASLIVHMKASGWAMPSAKPLVFLAHSLGGIVLKEAFTILADSDEQGKHILNLFKGGIFFGVPSQGMAVSHLLAMVHGQANEQLVHSMSSDSEFLRSLDGRFSGLASLRYMRLHLAYETKTSPTVLKNADGSFTRTGPEEILVSKASATRNLYDSRSSAIFPINENHSTMVKFREDDSNLRIVVAKLQESSETNPKFTTRPRTHSELSSSELSSLRVGLGGIATKKRDQLDAFGDARSSGRKWTIEDLMKSLEIPNQTHRIDTIDENFEHTSEWIFDTEMTSLQRWLREGIGYFWIHGKPGSGKSTLMKFIDKNPRTWEYLHKFSSQAKQVRARFFFHDRGSLLQKSFEGLLRSVLHQLLAEVKADLVELFEPLLRKMPLLKSGQAHIWTIGELESFLHLLLRQTHVDLDIFLLLDALDEYDGQPEFIGDFLEHLVSMTNNSRTKLKILFSSRPWDPFIEKFESVPSIRLQDYTTGDIRDYCWGTISSESEDISTKLKPIIPQITSRADGVFLWVKLVLRELINEARQGKTLDDLSNTLNQTPSELQEYYTRIVQRIPKNHRWDAYVILSATSISTETLSLYDVIEVLNCSRVSTYQECRKGLATFGNILFAKHRSFIRFGFRRSRVEKRLANIILATTGNLAEVIHHVDINAKLPQIQLAHQTVQEFVRSRDFKRCILGPEATQVQENGWTFLAKHYLAQKQWRDATPWIRKHESTTGIGMDDFIDSLPKTVFELSKTVFEHIFEGFWHSDKDFKFIDGRLAFATTGGFLLYLKGALRRDPDVFRKTQENLLSIYMLEMCIYRSKHEPLVSRREHSEILHLLLENGYTIKHPREFEQTIQYQHQESYNRPSFEICCILEAQVGAYIKLGQDANRGISPARHAIQAIPMLEHKILEQTQKTIKALHLARTDTLATCLLEHGADVNALDSSGRTPLDAILKDPLPLQDGMLHRDERFGPLLYRTLKLLIEHGGIAGTSTKEDWDSYLALMQSYDLDIQPLEDLYDRVQLRENVQRHLRSPNSGD